MINFFKRFKRKQKENKEIVSLEDSKKKAREIFLSYEDKEKEIFKEMKKQREIFIANISNELSLLREFNLEKRKEDIRLKERVLDSKDMFVIYSEKLLKKISEIEVENPESFIKEINQIAMNFEKTSRKSFEVATILIGEEIAKVRNTIRGFFRNQERIYSDNKEVLNKKNLAEKLIKEKDFLNSLVLSKKETKEEILKSENFLKENNSLIKKKEQEISNFKKSQEFKNFVLEIEKNKNLEIVLIKKINILKEKINLKELLDIHHRNEKMRELIRRYRNNFFQAFILDKDNIFLEIIPKEIEEELLKIKSELDKLNKKDKLEIEKKKEKFEKELEEIYKEIERVKREKEELEKKILKIEEREKEKIIEIKNYLERLGFIVE